MGGVVDFVKDVVETVVDFVVDVVETVVDFVGDVVGFVISPFGAFDAPDVPDPGAAATGVTVSKPGTNNPLPVVYGYRRVGGNIIYAESNGESNKYLYIVYAVCEGEIHGIRKLIVNDVELPTRGTVHDHGVVYNVDSGRFQNRMKYQIFNGLENQAQSSLANETPNWPKKQRKLPGIAYVVCRFEWKSGTTQEEADKNPYSGGIPKVSFDVYGKKIYDVRTHGSGKDLSGSYASRSKSYNFNPANCLLDYLENTRYGAGLNTNQIDAEAFKIAANKFEQTVSYSNNQTGRAMTMNAVISTGAKIFDNLKTMVSGSRSIMPYVQGRYRLKVEDGGHPTDITSTTVTSAYDITMDHVVGGITLIGERKTTKYNQVIVNYIDPDKNFTNQQVVVNSAGDQTIDNEEELSGEFTFHTLTNPAIARDLAQMIYDKSRTQRQIKFTGTQELINVEVGDVVRVTDAILDLDQQTFRVHSMKLLNSGLVEIEATEHDAALYPFTSGEQIELDAPLFIPDDYQIVPYVRPLPPQPTSVVPPLDPDFDSAGQPVEVNAPGDAPDADLKIVGITQFDDFTKSYPPVNAGVVYQGTLPDGTFYHLGNTLTVFTKFYFTANGKMSLASYNNNAYYTFESYAANVYHMARRRTYSRTVWNGVNYVQDPFDGYQLDLIMPKDTRIDRLIIRGFSGGTKVVEQIEDVMDPNNGGSYPSLYNPSVVTRTDPFTGVLRMRRPMLVNYKNSDPTLRWTVRWASIATGDEFEDGSDFSDVGFTGHSYKTPGGINLRKNNLEAYFNFIFFKYHEEQAATAPTGTTVSNTANLGG